uniref:Uncharacterized protein n=1 Tax=Strombidium rassoulzadegani TaxID=1082188 RepID=A0A7S3CVE2_9SPIT
MYYNYLNRDQLYLKSYRTHNLWFNQYHKKVRTPRVTAFHIGFLKRMGKSYSGTRVVAFMWGLTVVSGIRFMIGFSKAPTTNGDEQEIYFRLNTIFQKNKFGYNTRFMSDFDLLLEGVLNERFIDESTLYYDNPVSTKEIEDVEQGLNGEVSEDDIKNMLKDKQVHGAHSKVTRYPGRMASNYTKSDDLSCYKVHPEGVKPKF